jgi:hypothetical protein
MPGEVGGVVDPAGEADGGGARAEQPPATGTAPMKRLKVLSSSPVMASRPVKAS